MVQRGSRDAANQKVQRGKVESRQVKRGRWPADQENVLLCHRPHHRVNFKSSKESRRKKKKTLSKL